MNDYYKTKREKQEEARQQLGNLLVLHNNRCHYCDLPVVRVAHIQSNYKVVKNTGNTISWVMGTHIYEYAVATTDHIQPLISKGESVLNNLILACWWCNIRKSRYLTVNRKKGEIPVLTPRRKSLDEYEGTR